MTSAFVTTLKMPETADELIARAITAPRPEEALPLLRAAGDTEDGKSGITAARIAGLAGYMLHRLGDLAAARSEFERAETLWGWLPSTEGAERRAAMLCNYANLLCDLGAFPAASRRMEAALEIERGVLGPTDLEHARTLVNAARLSRAMQKIDDACRLARQAIEILEPNPELRAKESLPYARSLLATVLMDAGDWHEALNLFEAVEVETRQTADRGLRTAVLNNLGWAHYQLGDFVGARIWHKAALAALRGKGTAVDRIGEATILTNLGTICHKLDDFDAALRLYEEARTLLEPALTEAGHPQLATILCNEGIAFMRLGQYSEARSAYSQALVLQEVLNGPDHQAVADVRFHMAELTWATGTPDATLIEAIAVLGIAGLHENLDLVWRDFDLISRALSAAGKAGLAILFGKEAVEVLEALLPRLKAMGHRAGDMFARSRALGYQDLAAHLVAERRLAEAEHVLARLRAGDQVERLGLARPALPEQPSFTPEEAEWRQSYAPVLERIAVLRNQSQTNAAGGDNEQEAAERRRELSIAAQDLKAAIGALIAEWRANAPTRAETQLTRAETVAIRPGEIFLHLFPAGKYLWVLRRDSVHGDVLRRVETDEATVNGLIFEFRRLLSTPATPRAHIERASKELYDLLLWPVLGSDLRRGGRLIIWMDGAFRLLPPAALYDGERYLVEKVAIAHHSPFSRATANRRALRREGIAGFAVTRPVEGFDPLPFARAEVEAVIGEVPGNGLFRGQRYFDAQFTPEALKEAASIYGSLLIATHFVLRPADMARSGLLTGRGTLMPLRHLAELKLDGLALATLSACDTGTASVADGGGLLQSFADRLLAQGTGAILASLWRISDEGTARLVTEFYANLATDDAADFATALAKAQTSMLHGTALRRSRAPGDRGIGSSHSVDNDNQNLDLDHPSYWAPFVLLGEPFDSQ